MPALNYITSFENVQSAFLLMFGLCLIGFFINRRFQKAQDFEQEEKKEQRRERFMALERKPDAKTIDAE